jgi:hypothetical protein
MVSTFHKIMICILLYSVLGVTLQVPSLPSHMASGSVANKAVSSARLVVGRMTSGGSDMRCAYRRAIT